MTDYEQVKAWRRLNKDKVAAQARRYRAKHPGKVAVVKARYVAKNIDSIREKNRVAKRQQRSEDREGARQKWLQWDRRRKERMAGRPRPNCCELCGTKGTVVFDHCHRTQRFRGWLCQRCNRVLGSVKEDAGLLRSLIAYLERHRNEPVDGGAAQKIAKKRLRRTRR